MKVILNQSPFSISFLSEFVSVTKDIFGGEADQAWLDALQWRLQNMPDVTVFTVQSENGLVAYKAGYAIAFDRYHSWLGGVTPQHRRQGLGGQLTEAQHDWLARSRFQLIETHVEQNNGAMIQLNLNHGLTVTGEFLKSGEPYLIMQKKLNTSQ